MKSDRRLSSVPLAGKAQAVLHTRMSSKRVPWSTLRNSWSHTGMSSVLFSLFSSSSGGGGSSLWWVHHWITCGHIKHTVRLSTFWETKMHTISIILHNWAIGNKTRSHYSSGMNLHWSHGSVTIIVSLIRFGVTMHWRCTVSSIVLHMYNI